MKGQLRLYRTFSFNWFDDLSQLKLLVRVTNDAIGMETNEEFK